MIEKLLLNTVLSKQDLKSLDTYEYHSGTYTPLDNFLSPFYGKLINLFPRNLAPNTITILGLLFSMSSVVITCIYDPKLNGEAPQWVYLYASLANVLYMILDCLDGKQARRLHASSALGQIFDHGCDSLNTTFILIGIISALGLGQDFICPYIFSISMNVFACAQLCEYFSGILHCGTSLVGVTELLIFISLTYLFIGLYGISFLAQPVSTVLPFIHYNANLGSFIYTIIVFFFLCVATYISVRDLIHGESIPDHLKGNKNLSRLDYFGRLMSLVEITICSVYVISSDYHKEHITAVLLLSGITFSLFSTRCNISHLTRKRLSPIYVGGIPITVFAILLAIKHDSIQALYICLFLIISIYIFFVIGYVSLIKNHLHIRVFSVTPKSD